MNLARPRWYVRRLRAMSPQEVAWRVHDKALHWGWARRQVRPGESFEGAARRVGPGFVGVLPPGTAHAIPAPVSRALVEAADQLVQGRGEILGVVRTDLAAPDWFADPVTGRRAPHDRYAFRIDHRSATETGNVKQLWELSRLQHVTVLAGAHFVTGDDAYAEAAAAQLESWWRENPFLSGVHWTSGIEVGLRLITWVWVRRLLDGWPGAAALFEDNPVAVAQVSWHQQYLAAFRSRGSSANNHVIAEAAGQLVASCAFPWFASSVRWRRQATLLLEDELERNTFGSGLNREQASDYHAFVTELGLIAGVEAAAAGYPLSAPAWETLGKMVDAAAAILDETGRAPRQGDSDEGRAVVLDPPDANRWDTVLGTGAALFGSRPWWPPYRPGVTSTVVGALVGRRPLSTVRPAQRPSHFADAGLTILRTSPGTEPEIWCRCDGGPHGFLSIAGHAHADALSVEVRLGGVDVLADPGTYCYHGEPAWRHYFRSTVGHNTVEVGGQDQSLSGGPFLWLRHAHSVGAEVVDGPGAEPDTWSAEHHGYSVLVPPVVHRRRVHLDRGARRIEITDRIATAGRHPVRMAWQLGPTVHAVLEGTVARLRWPTTAGEAGADLRLAEGLSWVAHRGESQPVLGWYSARFGVKEPTTTLVGAGQCGPGWADLRTSLEFGPAPRHP